MFVSFYLQTVFEPYLHLVITGLKLSCFECIYYVVCRVGMLCVVLECCQNVKKSKINIFISLDVFSFFFCLCIKIGQYYYLIFFCTGGGMGGGGAVKVLDLGLELKAHRHYMFI